MTLKSLITAIEALAHQTPGVGTVIVNDYYRINELPNIEYACVGVQQTQHEVISPNVVRYGLHMVYADRLTADKSNELQVQSDGMLILGNIINALTTLRDVEVVDNISFETFTQRFADECAVVVATFEVESTYDLGECFEGNHGFVYDFDFAFNDSKL